MGRARHVERSARGRDQLGQRQPARVRGDAARWCRRDCSTRSRSALAADYLKIAMAPRSRALTERRIDRLLEPRDVAGCRAVLADDAGPRVGLHDGAVHRGRARVGEQGARASGERRLDPDRCRPRGPREHGADRGAPRARGGRQHRARGGARAALRVPRARVPPPAHGRARARSGSTARCAGWSPAPEGDRPLSEPCETLARWVLSRGARAARARRCSRRERDAPTARAVRAPRGTERSCRGWAQEAALRMLMNNLDPEVAERPDDLVVYGGTGKAARSWEAFDRIVARCARSRTTRRCSSSRASRSACSARTPTRRACCIANSLLVPHWATWEHFWELEGKGLIDVRADDRGLVDLHRLAGHRAGHLRDASPSARRGTSAAALAGRLVLTAGLGGMGGAQPLAVTMNGGVCLAVEVDEARARRRVENGLLRPHDALARRGARAGAARRSASDAAARASGSSGNAAEVHAGAGAARARARRGDRSDVGARSARTATCRRGSRSSRRPRCARADPSEYVRRARASMARTCSALLAMKARGAVRVRLRQQPARRSGAGRAAARPGVLAIPGFVPEYIRPLFCVGKGPFRWAALSGDPADILATDRAALEEFPDDARLHRWIPLAAEARAVPGTAGAHLLARLRRARAARAALQPHGARGRAARRRS